MIKIVYPEKLNGTVTIPPSKSQGHRMLICSALSNKTSNIGDLGILDNNGELILSVDLKATMEALKMLGAKFEIDGASVKVFGIGQNSEKRETLPIIDCKESGSTLRFLIPISLLYGGAIFKGEGRLMERPMEPFIKALKDNGIACKKHFGRLEFHGTLKHGEYLLPGNVSSQYISGLLFALPLLKKGRESIINIDGKLESLGYVNMTVDTLNKFGVKVTWKDDNTLIIPSGQSYDGVDCYVEGDYSQAAFYLAANEIGNKINIVGLNDESLQGDKEIVNIIEILRAKGYISIDMSQTPDIVPPVAVIAALRNGVTRLTNLHRLRMKESDRLSAIATELNNIGADVMVEEDSLIFNGVKSFTGGNVSAWSDHRIAMMLGIASTRCSQELKINGADCVTKSYPNFWDDIKKLGGRLL